MSALTITTNNQPRDIVYWWQLTAKEQAEFDWLDTADKQEAASFVRYRGEVYATGEFSTLRNTGTPEFKTWDGYHGDSYFSGVVLRYTRDHERVIMGTYCC